MNVEERRLNTFQGWPGNAAVESSRIAQAGFYFTGPGLKVTCFSCGCNISDWNYGDQVMTRHRMISPNCAFVRDPGSSGNVPLTVNRSTPQTYSPSRSSRTDRDLVGVWESGSSVYKSEFVRLESFYDWPIPYIVSPESLAETGFFFLHDADRVQCVFCRGIVCFWQRGDIAEVEHRRHFPDCPFLQGLPVGNIPRNSSLTRTSTGERICTLDNFEELGIQRHRGPRNSKFSTVESRLRTFADWPSTLHQKPIDLAQAGFFYIGNLHGDGTRDFVRCFHCDGGLKFWEPQDEPWIEHARWFPTCPFLLLVKGQEYVNDVQRLYSSDSQSKPVVKASTSSSDSKPSGLQGTLSVSMPSLSNPHIQEDVEELSSKTSENLTLEEENRRLREARQCKICMDAEVGAVLLPCGHLVVCVDCAPSLEDCPVCRQQIKLAATASERPPPGEGDEFVSPVGAADDSTT